MAGLGAAGRSWAGAAALSAQQSGADKNVRPARSAVAATGGGAVGDRARDRDQRGKIWRAVERHRHRYGGVGRQQGKRQAAIAIDMYRGPRSPPQPTRAARFWLTPD